jgi:triosephosphate isomerase
MNPHFNQKFIIGNWKQNPESLEIAEKLIDITSNFYKNSNSLPGNPMFFVTHAVPSIFVGFLKSYCEKKSRGLEIILQDISCFEGGSHTGEISATQAKKINIEGSIVGHSETRLSPQNPRGDEDKEINLKIQNLFKDDMFAVLCVGEYSRDGLDFENYISNQIKNCLAGTSVENFERLRIAYEPVWAIGKDAKRPATNQEIVDTIKFIKDFLIAEYGDSVTTKTIPILYGGSVDENNAKEILELDGVDGLLIGRASSDPVKWEKLLHNLLN